MQSKLLVCALAIAAAASAQRSVQLGVVYNCSGGRTLLKVESCAGAADEDACVIQYLDSAQQPGARISAPRGQVTQMLASCAIERPPEKKQSPPPAVAPAAAQSAPPAPAPRPAPSAPAPAQRPAPARPVAAPPQRSGPTSAKDRTNGIYEPGDRVEVSFAGQWVDSRVVDGEGMRYKVTVPGNKDVWARPDQIRRAVPAPAPSTAVKTKGPPCGTKLEGRWGSTTGIGGVTIEFRSGKAKVIAPFTEPETMDCVLSGDKIVLTKPGDPDEVEFHINDDGTIDAGLFGDLRRKGK